MPVRRSHEIARAKWLLVGAVIIGLLPFPLDRLFDASIVVAFLLPLLLSMLACRFLQTMSMPQQIVACCVACVTSTVSFSLVIVAVGWFSIRDVRIAWSIIPAGYWQPWLLLFTLTTLAMRYVLSRSSGICRWFLSVCLAIGTYVFSSALCFDFKSRTVPPDVEQPDASGREPALGPRVYPVGRLICRPRGPSFLFSRDYDESEWIWKMYHPLISIWFARPDGKYYYPYR